MLIFDVHQHAGPMPMFEDTYGQGHGGSSWVDDDYKARVKAMELHGISQAAIGPTNFYTRVNGLRDTMEMNDAVASFKKRDPQRFPLALGVVEPLYGAASIPELDRIKRQLHMNGVMFHHRFQGTFIDNWIMRPYLQKMRELELIPFIHIMAGSEMENVWRLRVLAEEFPDITFVALDSLSSFYQLEEIIQITRRVPNIYWDTACLWQGAFTVARFVHHAGPDRLMFASDLYGSPTGHSPAENLSAIQMAEISEADKQKILRDNAARLFQL